MTDRPPPPFEQRSLNPLGRRLRQLWLRRVSKRFVHGHRVARVRIGERQFKRIRFGDAWLAERTAGALQHFAGSGAVPELVASFDEELLVEFVEGDRLRGFEPDLAQDLASFYARIHAGGAREVSLAESGAADQADRDLDFLASTGVLAADRVDEVEKALQRMAPPRVYLGWDYTDAVPKNFVRAGDRLVGIDVEALQAGGLVGIGIAKLLARSGEDFRRCFLEAFGLASPLDLAPSLPFVELCFRLRWLKNRCLKGSRLDPEILEAALHGPGDVE